MGSSHTKEETPAVEQREVITGNQPDGHMTWLYLPNSLPGYSRNTRIEMFFDFDDGIQTEKHPNPGKPYQGLKYKAYLPRNSEGEKVVTLLKRAFDQRLLFTIHTNSSGEDMVAPADIPLKPRDDTSGSDSLCYPDPDYLKRVREVLKCKGIE